MELALIDTNVYTGIPRQPLARAVLIRNGRIAMTGSTAEIRREASAGAEIVALPGRLVTPGLVDAHLHFISFGLTLSRVDLRNLTSIQACRERIAAAAAKAKPGQWILGFGWNHHMWCDGRGPAASDLDDLTPNNPVLLHRMCGHSVWVNTEAMRIAGLTADTSSPAGTEVVRDAHGRPTGWIKEWDEIIECCLPELSRADLMRSAEAAQTEAFRHGVTGVHSLEPLANFQALAALDREARLKLRVHHSLPPRELDAAFQQNIRPGQISDRLWFHQLKLFADGSLGSGTALLHEEYSDEPGQFGLEYTPTDTLRLYIESGYAKGLDVAVHAIGDKALTNTLNAFTQARKNYPGPHRDRIEHVQLFTPADLGRMKDLNLVASVQPVHVMSDWSIANRRWGENRAPRAYAYKSLADAGLPVQFGSDAPVEPIDPVLGLMAAVTRCDLNHQPAGGWRPEQCLTLEQALTAFTAVPAYTARKEQVLGDLSAGKWADLTVLDKNLFELPPQDWAETKAELTIIGGEVVYRHE